MSDIEREKLEYYINKIGDDAIFASSSRYRDMLIFIITESLKGTHIKELNIAAQLYGENFSEDKSDGRVRVYMHNLRKKLSQYYQTSGKDDEVVFVLERGNYNIQIQRSCEVDNKERCEVNQEGDEEAIVDNSSEVITAESLPASSGFRRWGILSLALLLLVVFALNYGFGTRQELYLWRSLLDGESKTLCILADQVTVHPAKDSLYSAVVHSSIKNRPMYHDYVKSHPDEPLSLNTFTLFSKAIPYATHRLTEWFCDHGQRFTLTPESSFTMEDIKSRSIIYIGQFKTMNTSSRLFLRGSSQFSVDNKFIYAGKSKEQRRYRAKFVDGKELTEEYAIVSYMPLHDDKKALFFVSNHDIGTIATLENFTDEAFLREFHEQLPSTDSHFNALFKVEGIGRTNIKCTLVELEVL